MLKRKAKGNSIRSHILFERAMGRASCVNYGSQRFCSRGGKLPHSKGNSLPGLVAWTTIFADFAQFLFSKVICGAVSRVRNGKSSECSQKSLNDVSQGLLCRSKHHTFIGLAALV